MNTYYVLGMDGKPGSAGQPGPPSPIPPPPVIEWCHSRSGRNNPKFEIDLTGATIVPKVHLALLEMLGQKGNQEGKEGRVSQDGMDHAG
jgi:hypothetical protein